MKMLKRLKADVWSRTGEIAGFTMAEMEEFIDQRRLACYEYVVMRVVVFSLLSGVLAGILGYVGFREYWVTSVAVGSVLGMMITYAACRVSYRAAIEWLDRVHAVYLKSVVADCVRRSEAELERSERVLSRMQEVKVRLDELYGQSEVLDEGERY